jgi:hypothetical protein
MGIDLVQSTAVTLAAPGTDKVLGITKGVTKPLTPRIPPINLMDALVHIRPEASLMEALTPKFKTVGFDVVLLEQQDEYASCKHEYTALKAPNREVALLQVPNEIFEPHNIYLGLFIILLKVFRGKSIRLLSEGVQALKLVFQNAFEDEMRGDDWKFVNWVDIKEFQEGVNLLPIVKVFKIEPLGSSISLADAKADLIRILANQAMHAPPALGVKGYFRNLVSRSDWPDQWKSDIIDGWTGSAQVDAGVFIDYVMGKGFFPAGLQKHDDSVLGWFIYDLLKNLEVSSPDDKRLATLILNLGLIRDQTTVDWLRRKYG